MNPRERYLHELNDALHVSRRRRARILAELGDHYDDAFTAEVSTGDERHREASRRLGTPTVVARACNVEAGRVAAREVLVVVAAVGMFMVGGLVVGARTAHGSAGGLSDGWLVFVQVTFFAAVLTAEVAVVAWLRGAARVLATWRLPALSRADRVVIRRCAAIALSASTVTAVGWSAALVVSASSGRHRLDAGAAIALAMMTVGVGLGWWAWRRSTFNLHDEAPRPFSTTVSTWSRLESGVLDAIRRWPLLACAVAAIGSALWVVRTAETPTIADAWPWAVAQACAVVAGFVVLRRPLFTGSPAVDDPSGVLQDPPSG